LPDRRSILANVNELDDVWSRFLAESGGVRVAGNSSVAEYLDLKATNDQIRETGVRWLFDSMVELAAEANRRNFPVSVEREDAHSFRLGNANIVGPLMRLRHGVRCLTVEAGWTRSPSDGFMRGQALAAARITHFGKKDATAELHLRKTSHLPQWFVLNRDETASRLEAVELMRHFAILLGR
jgi:hypothetical protein